MKPHAGLATAVGVWLLPIFSLAQSLPNELFFIGQFEIGRSTLDDVRSQFGQSKQFALEAGDGADIAVCYCNRSAASAPTIVFETGALGGWTVITAYRLTKRGRMRCAI